MSKFKAGDTVIATCDIYNPTMPSFSKGQEIVISAELLEYFNKMSVLFKKVEKAAACAHSPFDGSIEYHKSFGDRA